MVGGSCGVASQWALPRDVFGHYPITIRYSIHLCGLKTYRFTNKWLAHSDFTNIVHASWNGFISLGLKILFLN